TEGGVTALAFLDDGEHWVAGGRFGAVTVGDTSVLQPEARPVAPPLGHHEGARIEAVAALGHIALSGDEKGTVKLWDVERRELLGAFEPAQSRKITALALSPLVKVAATASADGTIALWSVERRSRLATLDLASSTDSPRSLVFENERTLCVGTARGVVHTFDLPLEAPR
ncbi:MAG TPA: hypothetical protein VFF73_20715, partial [Planctomycetota bacterium]|nr:hypothetical protein [Planctomycetota bacterium]